MKEKVLALIFLLQVTTSCDWLTSFQTPYLMGTSYKIPDGTPSFQSGYKDGCGTVLSTRASTFYRSKYKHNYNPSLISNPEYRFGYQRGYTYCFHAVVTAVEGPHASSDRYFFTYGNNRGFEMNGGDVNEAWGGFFGGAPSQIDVSTNFNSIVGVWGGSETNSAFGANPLWAGGSKGQFFGQ
jgi:hypothetical protein